MNPDNIYKRIKELELKLQDIKNENNINTIEEMKSLNSKTDNIKIRINTLYEALFLLGCEKYLPLDEDVQCLKYYFKTRS